MARDAVLGFMIYTIVCLQHVSFSQVCDTQTLELQVKKEHRELEFPGYQNASIYADHCQWRLTTEDQDYTIEVTMQSVFISNKRNCSMSSLSLYDGYGPTDYLLRQECSNRTERMVVNSSNEYVYIVWLLPAGLTSSNTFTLTYAALENEGKTHTFTKTSLAGVIAGVILFVVFTLSIVGAIICCFRNRSQMQRRNLRLHDSYINDS
ncbi:uncharacterized protein LOC117328777 [Pecten maximus]|uniref:uncharacterized protein LOC117328777 n=1 Tax=Pecten maximus TaxID=6579 RepID=UPI0014591014|nr:uncharacterized protein LOC117328777 [Pecten maximus]